MDSLELQFIGYPLRAVGGAFEAKVEDHLLDLRRNAVGMGSLGSPAALQEHSDASGLEGALDFVEGVEVVDHDLAGPRHVSELLGKFEQRELSSGPLDHGGHSVSSSVNGGWRFQFISEDRMAAAPFKNSRRGGYVEKLPS
jgi:hypothetical protein